MKLENLHTNFFAQLVLSIAIYVPMWYSYQMTYVISDDEVAIELDNKNGLILADSGWHWKQNMNNQIVRYSKEQTITYKDINESI